VNTTITYEFPLNEKIRTFIRLEHLFKQFIQFSTGLSITEKRAAITCLLDIIAIFKRTDLRAEVLKELNHQSTVLKKIAKNDDVNKEKLNELLEQLERITKTLHGINGKIGLNIMQNDLLQSIVQRSSIPGGTCSFDLPEYHFWLSQDEPERLLDLESWSNPFIEIHNALDFILNFIRNSRPPKAEIASAGFFQIALDQSQQFQLIKVSVDSSINCFAEISGGKHRCNIRFMEVSKDNKRPVQSVNDIPFNLTRCLF
jgi:cell division protein ZapD